MKIVVFSPHRDDAAFSAGLATEQWLAAGHQVSVVNCFTKSEYAPFSDVESLHPHDRTSFVSALRRREDVAWSKCLKGRFEIQDLDMLDAPLRLPCSVDEVTTVEIRLGDRAVARVAGAVRKLARNAEQGGVAMLFPLAVGDHIDHRVVRAAALEVLKDTAVACAFYEDLPYSARGSLQKSPEGLAAETGLELQPTYAAPAVVDVQVAVGRKRRFAECYDSQVDSGQVNQIAEFCVQYGGRERLWGNAGWVASALASQESLL